MKNQEGKSMIKETTKIKGESRMIPLKKDKGEEGLHQDRSDHHLRIEEIEIILNKMIRKEEDREDNPQNQLIGTKDMKDIEEIEKKTENMKNMIVIMIAMIVVIGSRNKRKKEPDKSKDRDRSKKEKSKDPEKKKRRSKDNLKRGNIERTSREEIQRELKR